jgi:hypothetical protein
VNKRHYVQKTDGTWVSKKEHEEFISKINKEFIESFTQEEIELFSNIRFQVDTLSSNVQIDTVSNKTETDTITFDRTGMKLFIIEGVPTWVDTTGAH